VHHIFKTLAVIGALLFSDQLSVISSQPSAIGFRAQVGSGPSAVTSRLPARGGAPPQAGGTLPNDINPDSRSRLPPINRASLTPEARKAYDAAAMTSPTGRPEGVATIRLHRSSVDVRWDSVVGRRLTELAIITAAREHDQPYEWSLHEMEALSVGLEPAIVDVVRHRRPLANIGDKEAAIVQFGRELGAHRVSAETYARALKLFGQTSLVDIVDLMAQYAGTAANLTAANQWMPPQMKQFLPLPFTPPDDILPDSRSRIPVVNPDASATATQGQAQPPTGGLYRRTLAPPPTGPGSMARFAAGLKSLESSQGQALMALSVLVTAREHDQQYDWTQNELAANRDGLAATTIEIVRLRKPLTGLTDKEAAIIQFGRELFGKHYVTAETYGRAKQVFGQRDLSDFVVNVMAPHAREAALLTAFDQQLPAGQKPLLPIP
jgi:4-carboxymuconolactone decarboxylase